LATYTYQSSLIRTNGYAQWKPLTLRWLAAINTFCSMGVFATASPSNVVALFLYTHNRTYVGSRNWVMRTLIIRDQSFPRQIFQIPRLTAASCLFSKLRTFQIIYSMKTSSTLYIECSVMIIIIHQP